MEAHCVHEHYYITLINGMCMDKEGYNSEKGSARLEN